MLIASALMVLGLVTLFVGGHYLVRGATRMALLARVSTTVVGLTVVAMGTSFPELAVSMGAAARGVTDLAYGNIVGSTVFNVGMILSIAAVLAPIAVRSQTIKIEYPFMFVAACLVLILCRDRVVDQLEGAFLFMLLVIFTSYIVLLARRAPAGDDAEAIVREVRRTAHLRGGASRAWGVNILLAVFGIGALVAGADLVVWGAVRMAVVWEVNERLIGLTVVAMGTSLPELATSVVAAREGEHEIALANVIGSNVFNLLGVLGATAAIFPVPIQDAAATLDNWVMLGFCAGMFPLMWFGRRVGRWDGAILMVGFVAYLTYIILHRTA